MLGLGLRVVGSLVLIIWGVAHIVPVRSIVRGFGALSPENRRIVSSTWVAEGLTLIFVGAIMGLTSYYGNIFADFENLLTLACAGFLLGIAVLDAFTKARNPSVPMKICPFIVGGVGIAYLIATMV